MIEWLSLNRALWETMQAHVDICAPEEACGLLAGVGNTVQEVFLVQNREESASRFRMDAAEQLRAFRSIEDRGMELLGIFHSHPADTGAGPIAEGPSATDIREAAYPVVHVIWSRDRGSWQARGFWIEAARVLEVPLHITMVE